MTSEYELVDADEAVASNKGTRVSPAQKMIESLPPGFYTYEDMTKRYGVHKETMRRLCKATDEFGEPKVKAPSKAIRQGGLVIYLFTEEDVAELDGYFRTRGRVIHE